MFALGVTDPRWHRQMLNEGTPTDTLTLLTALLTFVTGILDVLFGLAESVVETGPIGGIFSLLIFIPSLGVAVRRLHDIERTGWWLLAIIVPSALIGYVGVTSTLEGSTEEAFSPLLAFSIFASLAGVILLLCFSLVRGTEGANRYGPDPHG